MILVNDCTLCIVLQSLLYEKIAEKLLATYWTEITVLFKLIKNWKVPICQLPDQVSKQTKTCSRQNSNGPHLDHFGYSMGIGVAKKAKKIGKLLPTPNFRLHGFLYGNLYLVVEQCRKTIATFSLGVLVYTEIKRYDYYLVILSLLSS